VALPCDDVVLNRGTGHPSASGNAFLLILLVLKHEMEKHKDSIRYRIFLADFPAFGKSKIDPKHPESKKKVGARSAHLDDWETSKFGAVPNHVPSLLAHSFGSMCAAHAVSFF
jgi:hypothetical protein